MQLLGGFAGRISPKRRSAPAFPQVGEADSERPPLKTAQKPRTHGEIGARFLRNRPEPARARPRAKQRAASADAGATRGIAANTPPSPVHQGGTLHAVQAPRSVHGHGADLFFVRQQPPKAGAPSPGERRIRCAENRATPSKDLSPAPMRLALSPLYTSHTGSRSSATVRRIVMQGWRTPGKDTPLVSPNTLERPASRSYKSLMKKLARCAARSYSTSSAGRANG